MALKLYISRTFENVSPFSKVSALNIRAIRSHYCIHFQGFFFKQKMCHHSSGADVAGEQDEVVPVAKLVRDLGPK